ncbi:hypothetical protein ACFQFC_20540 [Amorphoplanes digitatis]|uniref:Uncharacterized protein n=1 Tax=Actinoplanes digitatis TaxID=1868 RepID=A0A7W7I5D9_9ACTN|nr:hypothetical protein [Actinoplanes digitatis]MBB4766606.1 hypothetical protein [Actinoplanes digitatis]GID97005.1 hypothetical protein Adi01nite_64170 [Actinoplanes digitatis]
MPDQLEALFADLRAETLPHVRPPGTEAARHTVRRRRTRRTVATAAVALTVAGGLAAANLPTERQRPVSPAERMNDLVDAARLALDDQLPKLTGRLETGAVEAGGRLAFAGVTPGGYTMAVTCAGPGLITIDIEQARNADESAVLGRRIVPCAESPVVAVTPILITFKGPVLVSVAGNWQAAGNAVYAVKLGDDGPSGDDALHDDDAAAADESIRNADRAAEVLTSAGATSPLRVTTEQMRTRQATGYARPGNLELRFACAGPGSLNLTVAAVPPGGVPTSDHQALLSLDVLCDRSPWLTKEDVLSLPADTTLMIIVVPDGPARNHAGWAYQVSPA